MARVLIAALAVLAGVALAAIMPELPAKLRQLAGLSVPTGVAAQAAVAPAGRADSHGADTHAAEGKIAMTAEQITAANIQVAMVGGGVLVSRVAVPGVLSANADRLARVTARVGGTIAEVRKRLGEPVAAGDVLAVIESRDIADAKGEFLTASRAAHLASVTFARESRLWTQRISPEQDFLQARGADEEARVRLDLARQRLSTLGLSDAEIVDLPRQPVAALRRLELRAPIAGRVIARAAVLGAAVAADTELFSVADLTTVWVEMAIPPRDLLMAREGQRVSITGEGDARGDGKIVFLSPVLDAETRSARAVAEIDNADGAWRPGAFVTAQLATDEQAVDILIPRSAVQELEGERVVFVRTAEGFEKREVAFGREDAAALEVIFGLDTGAEIAVGNAFVLRAELGKSEATHNH